MLKSILFVVRNAKVIEKKGRFVKKETSLKNEWGKLLWKRLISLSTYQVQMYKFIYRKSACIVKKNLNIKFKY